MQPDTPTALARDLIDIVANWLRSDIARDVVATVYLNREYEADDGAGEAITTPGIHSDVLATCRTEATAYLAALADYIQQETPDAH